MSNTLSLNTNIIILTDTDKSNENDAVDKKYLIAYVVDDLGHNVPNIPVEFKADNKFVIIGEDTGDVVLNTDSSGKCQVQVSLDPNLTVAWASEAKITVSIPKSDENERNEAVAKVYYGTLQPIDFLNIKYENDTYIYDNYLKEKETIILIHRVNITEPLILTLYFDEMSYTKLVSSSSSFPVAIDLRTAFNSSLFSDGMHHLYYTLTSESGNIATSLDFYFRLDYGITNRKLPEIEVPNLHNGYINQELWLNGVEYNFKPILEYIANEKGLANISEINDLIESEIGNDVPMLLRFQGRFKNGEPANLTGDLSSIPFTKQDIESIIEQEGLYHEEKLLPSDNDRYSFISEGSLSIDVYLKLIPNDIYLSKIKTVLVDILPPAKQKN